MYLGRLTSIVTIVLLFSLMPLSSVFPPNAMAGTFVSGAVSVDTTWNLADSPYIVVGDVYVLQGVTLTIEEGVEVRFDGFYLLWSNGTLLSLGTAQNRILITSNSPQPSEDGWLWVLIGATGSAVVTNTDIEYAKNGLSIWSSSNTVSNSTFRRNRVGIHVESSSNNTIIDSEFSSNAHAGIQISSGPSSPSRNQIERNRFSNNDIGIYLDGGENSIIRNRFTNNYLGAYLSWPSCNNITNNSFMGNAKYAIFSNIDADAKHNFWGTDDPDRIDRLASSNVDVSSPLSSDPTGAQLNYVNGTETWSGRTYLEKGLLVNGILTLQNAEVLFNASDGENFIQVNGGLWILNSSISSALEDPIHWGDYTVLFANNSLGRIVGSNISSQKAVSVFCDNMTLENNVMWMGYNGFFLKENAGVEIRNNDFKSNRYGIGAEYSSELMVSSNDFDDNYFGLWILYSDSVTIEENAFSNNYHSVLASYSEDVLIENNSVLRNLHAIQYFNSNRGRIAYNTVQWNRGDAMEIVGARNNTVEHNTMDENGIPGATYAQGIFLSASSNNIISNNTIRDNTDDGILIWLGSHNNAIRDNVFKSNSQYGISSRGILHTGYPMGNIIENNSITDNWEGVYFRRSFENCIRNNNISSNRGIGVNIALSAMNDFSNNIISSNLGHGIELAESCKNNTIQRNEISNNTGNGIESSGKLPDDIAWHNSIKNNLILGNDAGISLSATKGTAAYGNVITGNNYGINLLASAEDNDLYRNEIFDNGYGFLISSLQVNFIWGNNVTSNEDSAFLIVDSQHIVVSSNKVKGNAEGFVLLSASDTRIIQNDVWNNSQGIYLQSSSLSEIYHNSIINNTFQAFDDSMGSNSWDNGYPSGGNYWSDYTGIDQFSGPDQNQPGSDGIGDTPYYIDADSYDRYPFTDHAPFDATPPEILDVLLNGNSSLVVEQGVLVTLTALVDDRNTGNSTVFGSNYTLGKLNFPGHTMNPENPPLDTPTERFSSSINTSLLSPGSYEVCVYGWDIIPNFNLTGACKNLTVLVNPPPGGPLLTSAILEGVNFEDVNITWQKSHDDGEGMNDVLGYEIYRSTGLDRPYRRVASITANGSQLYNWVCKGCGEGNSRSYFFYVVAVDFHSGTPSPNTAGKFTRSLAPGPNLISIPLVQSNESIETVLQTVEYDKAWFYDSSSQEWKWHMTYKEYRRGLWNVNHTMGIWVNVTEDSNLTVAGIVPAQTMIHLYKGWNLVSFPSFNTSYTVSNLRAEVGATRVEGFDSIPPYHLRVLGDAEVLQAGSGYWVRVDGDIVWMIDIR